MDYKEKIIALLNSEELSQEQKEELKGIFPELAESEDERMKEAIIATIHLYYGEPLVEDEAKEMISWIEKQAHMLDHDKAIEWLKTNVFDDSAYGIAMIEDFKKYCGL